VSHQNNPGQLEGDPDNKRFLDHCTLDELIQKQIMEVKLLGHPTSSIKTHATPLFKDIQEYEFPKKFCTLIFDYYSKVSDPVQHICHFKEKMVIYSWNDSAICLTFPASLKGVASASTRCHPIQSTTSLR